MTPCVEHEPAVWTLNGDLYLLECPRCLAIVPTPTGYCARCGRLIDNHRHFHEGAPLPLPICPRSP